MQNPFVIGPNIYLRPLEKADAPSLAPWFNDAEVSRFLRIVRPMSVEAEETFIAGMNANPLEVRLGVVVRETDHLIGVTGLHDTDVRHRHTMFGIVLGDKTNWNKGYGTEATRLVVRYAFESLNLNRVGLQVFENNPRGVRAYEKAGFRIEGRLRQAFYCEGRYWDTFVMSILREEWVKKVEP